MKRSYQAPVCIARSCWSEPVHWLLIQFRKGLNCFEFRRSFGVRTLRISIQDHTSQTSAMNSEFISSAKCSSFPLVVALNNTSSTYVKKERPFLKKIQDSILEKLNQSSKWNFGVVSTIFWSFFHAKIDASRQHTMFSPSEKFGGL